MRAAWFPGNRNILQKMKTYVQAPLPLARFFFVEDVAYHNLSAVTKASTMPKPMRKQCREITRSL